MNAQKEELLEGGEVCRWIREWFQRPPGGLCERVGALGVAGGLEAGIGGIGGMMLVVSGRAVDPTTMEVYQAGGVVLFAVGKEDQLKIEGPGTRVLVILNEEAYLLFKAVRPGDVRQQIVEDREMRDRFKKVLGGGEQMEDPPWMWREWDIIRAREFLLFAHKRLRKSKLRMRAGDPVWMMGERILKLLEERMDEDLSLQEAAEAVGISGRQLTRTLHRVSGRGYIDNLNRIRLFAARQKLIHSRSSVERVARECGFGTVHHFIRTFRGWFGLTPLRFRKRYHLQEKTAEDWDSLLMVEGCELARWLALEEVLQIGAEVEEKNGMRVGEDCRMLYVGNARSTPVSLIRMNGGVSGVRQRLLEPGGLEALVYMPPGSDWRVENEKRELLGGFRTGKEDTLIILRPD